MATLDECQCPAVESIPGKVSGGRRGPLWPERIPELKQFFTSRIPLGRWGRVEDVGQLALFLCSEDAGFITGTDILIDGGWTAQ